MASGIILGNCPECGELIWEDQWQIAIDDGYVFEITHSGKCARDRYRRRYGMSESQFQRVLGLSVIEKDLSAIREEFQSDLHELDRRYQTVLQELSNRLKNIEKGNSERGERNDREGIAFRAAHEHPQAP